LPLSRWTQFARLAGCIAVVAVVWLAVLPFFGRQPVIESYIRRNERLGIDPSAKFYTEIPAMPELYEYVQHRRRK
jgi:hypothetical protein